MNVALWAEIRRLAEIEKLSARKIARRLNCSRDTVAELYGSTSHRQPGVLHVTASSIPSGPRSTLWLPVIRTSPRSASTRRSPNRLKVIPAA